MAAKTPPRPVKPKRPKGSVERLKDGRLQMRIRLADGSRIRSEPLPAGTSEEYAREKAAYWQEQHRNKTAADLGRKSPSPTEAPLLPLTAEKRGGWWDRYFTYRSGLGYYDTRGVFRVHVLPIIGDKEPRGCTQEDSRRLRRNLDDRITSGEVSAKTAFNAWTLWTTACKAACGQWAKDKDGIQFKVREDNIAANVHPPDRDDPKQLQFLYPDEFLALVSCEQVPLDWRRIYALAIYLVPRASELRALTWDNIDLAHGAISIRHAFDQERGEVKQTKTGNKGIRRFAIEPELLPLLRAMHEESGGKGNLVDLPDRQYWALSLREHLRAAGITRTELYSSDDTSRRLRFHDLRSSGLTWMALRGDTQMQMQGRAGHRSFDMTAVYVRTAENLRSTGEAIGTPFPPLPASLLGRKTSPIIPMTTQLFGPDFGPYSTNDYEFGGSTGTRTLDLRVKSPQLYQLSYRP